MQGLWAKTAASGFRMTAGTPSGRYGLPLWNREKPVVLSCGRLAVPLSRQSAAVRQGRRALPSLPLRRKGGT